MPFQLQVPQGLNLAPGILKIIFSKGVLARQMRLADYLGRECFTDRNQPHLFRAAMDRLRGCPDSVLNSLQTGCNIYHNSLALYAISI